MANVAGGPAGRPRRASAREGRGPWLVKWSPTSGGPDRARAFATERTARAFYAALARRGNPPLAQSVMRGKTSGRLSQAAGKAYAACALCRRRSLRPYEPGVPWRPKHWDRSQPPEEHTGPCCRSHEAAPVEPRLHQYDPSTRYVGGEGKPEACAFCLRPVADHGVEGTPCGAGSHSWRERGGCPESCPCVCHRPGGRP